MSNKAEEMLQRIDIDKLLESRFNGYHVEIELYPTGGTIECTGCDECGTSEEWFDHSSWRYGRGETFETAVVDLEEKMLRRYGPDWRKVK